ncbi:hypothetical protein, partial [Micromonospora harpali]
LTVGGATVDLRRGHVPAPYVNTCTGCGENDLSYGPHEEGYSPEDEAAYAEREARTAAQAHAETCRAMPAPQER